MQDLTSIVRKLMKTALTILFLNISFASFAQTQTKQEIVNFINSNCTGSPVDPWGHEEISCKFIDNYNFQYVIRQYNKNGVLDAKNVFSFNMKDLDCENLIPDGFNGKYYITLYTKDLKKKIKQVVYFPGNEGSDRVDMQAQFRMGNFSSRELTDKLVDLIIKYQKSLKT